MAAFMVASLLLLRRLEDGRAIYRTTVLLIGLVFAFFGFAGDAAAGRSLWPFAFPSFAMLMVGMRCGSIFTGTLLAVWIYVFATAGEEAYSRGFAVRFVASYVVLSILSLFAESVRQMHLRALTRQQARLRREKAELQAAEERMREMALRDELTGIANRRAILGTLEWQLGVATKDESSLAIALVDIDHFKRINDTHGHQAGDAVLAEVADRLRGGLRMRDRVGRYGGEEFLLVLPDSSRLGAAVILERIRRAVESKPFDAAGIRLAVTVSVGGVTTSVSGFGMAKLIRSADEALYEAKEAGRNRLVVAAPKAA